MNERNSLEKFCQIMPSGGGVVFLLQQHSAEASLHTVFSGDGSKAGEIRNPTVNIPMIKARKMIWYFFMPADFKV